MGDTEKQQICTPNIPLLPLSQLPPRGFTPEVDLFSGSKYENEKNEDYFAEKNTFFDETDAYGTLYSSSNSYTLKKGSLRNNQNTATKKHGGFGLYEDILREIRNMTVLTPYQLHYLRGVSNEQLLQIIEIYNLVMINVNEIL
jgi:hypothetical protein